MNPFADALDYADGTERYPASKLSPRAIANRRMAYIDAIADNPDNLIEALQDNRELAFHLCEFVAWALDFRHPNAPDELLRIAGMVDREIRKSAEELL